MIKKSRGLLVAMAVCGLVTQACGQTGTPDTTEALRSDASVATAAPTTTAGTAAPDTTSAATTTTAAPRLVELLEEPPDFEEVTIPTPDGLELYAKLWRGGDTAVIFGHDYDDLTAGSAGVRPPQSSDVVIPYTGTIANEGFTVLSPDFRGHGQSPGDLDVKGTLIDLKASYDWLQSEGFSTIVMIGWVGSGTAAVVLDSEDSDVDFDGIALLFSPLQDTGLDAQKVIGTVDTPMLFVGSDAGPSARGSRILEGSALDSRGVTVFDRVQTGLTFNDVFGPELAGLIVEFVEDVAA